MAKGIGIAALIIAIVAFFVPFLGIGFSIFALVLAAIAALAGDRACATATPIVVAVNTFGLSPSAWLVMAASADTFHILLLLLALPYVFVLIGMFGKRFGHQQSVMSDRPAVTITSPRLFLSFFMIGLIGLGISMLVNYKSITQSNPLREASSIEAPSATLNSDVKATPTASVQSQGRTATQTGETPQAIPPAKIIEQARDLDRRMADSNRPKPLAQSLKTPLVTKAEIEQTRAALQTVDKTTPQYREAQELLASLDKREQEGKRATEAAAAKAVADDVDSREDYAKALERNFLTGGYDVTVSAAGAKATVLTLRFVLFSRPVIYNLVSDAQGKETDFPATCRQLGFTKIVFTDGYEKTWTYSLQAAKSAAAPRHGSAESRPADQKTPPAPLQLH